MDDMTEVSKVGGGCAIFGGGARPYHHGDLRRALVDAAGRVLAKDGAQALSLRAVAREAGVSPAAPYHHFKDKSDLLHALAEEGFHALGDAMKVEFERDPNHSLTTMGLAYVKFARSQSGALSGDVRQLPQRGRHARQGARQGGRRLSPGEGSHDPRRRRPGRRGGLQLACIASWCTAHGLSEMASFAQFRPLIEELGGEEAFVRGVLQHIGHTRASQEA